MVYFPPRVDNMYPKTIGKGKGKVYLSEPIKQNWRTRFLNLQNQPEPRYSAEEFTRMCSMALAAHRISDEKCETTKTPSPLRRRAVVLPLPTKDSQDKEFIDLNSDESDAPSYRTDKYEKKREFERSKKK